MNMKAIYEKFTTKEHNALINAKKELSWHDFIMTLVKQTKKKR